MFSFEDVRDLKVVSTKNCDSSIGPTTAKQVNKSRTKFDLYFVKLCVKSLISSPSRHISHFCSTNLKKMAKQCLPLHLPSLCHLPSTLRSSAPRNHLFHKPIVTLDSHREPHDWHCSSSHKDSSHEKWLTLEVPTI